MMSSVAVRACVEELREEIVGGKVEKIYHHPPNEIRFKIYVGVRKDLVVEAGRRIHLTKFPKESPKFPSSFAMLLRKHLEGGRIEGVAQHDFDRIVVLKVKRRDEVRYIVAELFSKGNVILTDENFRVIMPLISDKIRSGETYSFPGRRVTPFDLSENRLEEIFREENREVVKVLATKCGLGGLFAEETCLRAGLDKRKPAKDLSRKEISKVTKAIGEIFEPVLRRKFKPHIVVGDRKYVDVLPIELKIYERYEKKYFETFNEALDEFYAKILVEKVEREEKEESEEMKKLRKRLEIQLQTKERLEKEAEMFRRIGDLIYENYPIVEKLLEAFRRAMESLPFDEVRKRARGIKIVKDVKPYGIVVDLEGQEVELDLNKNIHENADMYYERAKRAKEKLDGLLKAIEKTKEEMKRVEEIEAKKFLSSFRIVRRREWYERFRWFVTSEGFLAIGGRNAQMNEEIVSKYMEERDLFFHTQTPGAPVVVLKRGQEASEMSLIETAQFAAIYSSLWKEGMHSGEVYYVLPEQVKKAAKAGEYLPKGSFYIVGKRNYITVELRCAIGVDLRNLKVMGGPVSAIRKHCDYYVEIEIGDKDPNELSVEIASTLVKMAKEDEKHLVRGLATPDEIMKFLPPGRSRIIYSST